MFLPVVEANHGALGIVRMANSLGSADAELEDVQTYKSSRGATTFGITTLSIMTLSRNDPFVTLSINDTQHNNTII